MHLFSITPNQWLENGKVKMPRGKKAANYMDLFYDLLLVLCMSTIGSDFRGKLDEHHVSLLPVLDMFAFVCPVWLHSMALQAFSNRFGKVESLFSLSFYFLSFLVLGLLTRNIRGCGGTEPDCFKFCLFYAGARLLVTLCWLRAALGSAKGRAFCIRCLIHNGTVTLIWFTNSLIQSHFVPFVVLWWLAIIVDIFFYLLPVIPCTSNLLTEFIPVDVHLMDERMGLITLIAIGETLAAAVAPLHESDITGTQYIICGLVIGISFVQMVLYFRAGEIMVKEGKHALKVSKTRGIAWSLIHIPLIFALILGGSVVEIIVTDDDPSDFVRILYGYSIGAVFVISAVMQSLHDGSSGRKKKMLKRTRLLIRWFVGFAAIGVGFIPRESIAKTPLLPIGLTFFITASGLMLELWGSRSTEERIQTLDIQ